MLLLISKHIPENNYFYFTQFPVSMFLSRFWVAEKGTKISFYSHFLQCI